MVSESIVVCGEILESVTTINTERFNEIRLFRSLPRRGTLRLDQVLQDNFSKFNVSFVRRGCSCKGSALI